MLNSTKRQVLGFTGLLLAALLAPASAIASTGPLFRAPYTTFDCPGAPRSIALGDVNEDGHCDAVISAWTTEEAIVWEFFGRGDGTFTGTYSLAVGGEPGDVALADVNRDGRLDLILSDAKGDMVSVFLGTGQGPFLDRTDYPVGSGPTSVVVADLNGDSYPDLATANRRADSVSILMNNHFGQFGARQDHGVGTLPLAITAADVDGDGGIDLVVADHFVRQLSPGYTIVTGGVSVLPYGFQRRLDSPSEEIGYSSRDVAIADMNSDGLPDVGISNGEQNAVIMAGNGNGTFNSRMWIGPGTFDTPTEILLDDLTGDGHPDVFVGYRGATVQLYPGQPDGPTEHGLQSSAPGTVDALASADFDEDGIPDVMAVSTVYGVAAIYLSKNRADFEIPPIQVGFGFGALALGDLNEDGRLDIVAAHMSSTRTGSTISVCLQGTAGGFDPRTDYEAGHPYSLVLADLDRDGHLDLAASDRWVDSVSVYTGRGDGTFLPRASYRVGSNSDDLIAADLNQDGQPELISTNSGASSVSVLWRQSNGAFGAESRYATGSQPMHLDAGDLNGDGWLDLVVTNSANSISILNLVAGGGGAFASRTDLPLAWYPSDVKILDYDGDGRLDLVVANAGPSVLFYRGHGDGTFEIARELFLGNRGELYLGNGQGAIAAGDLNNDGRMDLAISRGVRISILLGNGAGWFDLQGEYGPGTWADPLIGDLDRDGRQDLVVSRNSSAEFTGILFNEGPGTRTAINLLAFSAVSESGRIAVNWSVTEAARSFRYDLYRQSGDVEREWVATGAPPGQASYHYDLPDYSEGEPQFWLRETSRAGLATWYGPIRVQRGSLPGVSALSPGWPNPFRSLAHLDYQLSLAGRCRLSIFDAAGRLRAILADRFQAEGSYSVPWDGQGLDGRPTPPGIYFVRLETDSGDRLTGKIVRIP